MKRITLFFCVTLFLSKQQFAQTTDSLARKTAVKFRLGVFYNSNLNYYGRTDSLRSQGLFPVGEIWIGEHFYLTGAPVFVMNNAVGTDYAGTVAVAGFRFGEPGKSIGNIYFVKPFYESNSQLVQSALKAQVAASGSWLNKVLNVTVTGDLKFSDKTDLGLSAGLDHLVRREWKGTTVLVIDPSVYVHAGTQQFTNTYYKQSGFLFFPGSQQEISEEVSRFSILSYEFSMPVILAVNKMQFIFTPAYVMPQNLVKPANRPDLAERGKNLFYATVGVKWNINQ